MAADGESQAGLETKDDLRLRDFLMVLRQALLMIVRWIEKRYGLGKKSTE